MLLSSTETFRQDCIRYESKKNSGKKCFYQLQGGNYEFRIAV